MRDRRAHAKYHADALCLGASLGRLASESPPPPRGSARPRRLARARHGARLSHETRRNGRDEHVPMKMSAGRRRAWSAEPLGEELYFGHLRKLAPAPPEGPTGPALATNLVKEEPADAIDDPIVVRFGDPPTSGQRKADEAPVGDGSAQQPIGVRGPRIAGRLFNTRGRHLCACPR